MVTPLQPEQPIPEGPVSSIVEFLLDKGADPNQKLRFYDHQTPWELFLTVCLSHSIKGDKYTLKGDEVSKTMLAMICHGADTHVTRENRHGDKIGILEVARGLDLPKRRFREIEDALKEKEKCQEAVLSSGLLGYVGTWIWGTPK
ncbi:uncharacterized protein CTRU02_207828 [Colletotrichum truncatum]|uniref:Uncharacterized protein n=1 Tax=Colletotrichum truncatum TaxID=5467 RepID=A0ACC3Z1W9_COLTU|nr:uncharacterized protein CTRU02_15172 [Colletotrichum truncatum]KAF6781389.1 hypothetical protein CTRU02_15172 [Colletotrichum truncatum]